MNRRKANAKFLSLFVPATLGVVLFLQPVMANITTTGDVDPLYDDSDPWYIDDDLTIGVTSDANMVVADGSEVSFYYGYIGASTTANGLVTVTGTGSLLESQNLMIGVGGGTGELTIADGGTVINLGAAYIGGFDPNLTGALVLDSNGIGSVTVTGSDSLWQTDSLYVGVWGQGQLDIFDGGLVDANSVFVGSTGIITGDGTIRTELLTNDGTIKPGSSIGTLTVDGDLLMDANSILEIEIDNSGNSDKLVVTGDVNIVGGTVKAITTETITGTMEYTILEANSVTGDFNSLDTALLHTSILYPYSYLDTDTNSVILQVYTYAQFDDDYICTTNNRKAVGKALQQIAESGGNATTTALQGFETVQQLRTAYDQLSGQTRLPLVPISVADTTKFIGMPANRLGDLQGGLAGVSGGQQLLAMSKPDGRYGGTVYDTSPGSYMFALGNGTTLLSDQKWGVWGKGYGLFGDRETENSEPGYQYTIYGAGFGIDYQFTEQAVLGITGGYSNGDVDHSSSRDVSDICGKHIGLYGTVEREPWYFSSVLTYSQLEYQTQRYVDMTAERLDGDFGGYAATGYFEAGFNWIWSDDTLIRPSASFQVSYLDLDGYTESGGSSSLTYEGQICKSYKSSLGFRVTPDLSRNPQGRESLIELRGRWVHEFGDVTSSLPVHFASDPGAVFTISDENTSRDSAVVGAGLHVKLGRNGRLFVDYDASLNSHDTAHAVGAGLEYRW